MTILISGGTGFVGLALTEALLARGEHVVIYGPDAPPAGALPTLSRLPGRLSVEIGDVRDTAAFTACLRRHKVASLFPFAAITSGPERESETPELVVEVNLLGFISQLRAARDAGVGRVVAPSSSAVYGESFYGGAPVAEEGTPCVPISLYGVTKYAVERTALRLGALWNLDVVAARIGAVFGPWERDSGVRDALSPHWQLARAAVSGTPAVLPAEIMAYSWVYARDAASALVHLLDLKAPAERVFNICSGIAWGPRILEWCGTLSAEFPDFRWRQSPDPDEVTIRFTDARPRATTRIDRIMASGWSPAFPPELAYADYLSWLKHHAALAA